MTIFNPKSLKAQAEETLDSFGTNRHRLILIHTGIVVLISLLGSAINIYLNNQIGDTGGLSGLGLRSFLQTVQTVLEYATIFFTPFWQAGFFFVALRWVSDQHSRPRDLFSGFRRFSSVLSYQFFLVLIYFFLGMACAYIASFVFSLTPFSASLLEILEPLVAEGTVDITALEAIGMDTLIEAYLPMIVIYLLILVPALIYLSYNLRLAVYFIMDQTKMSGLRAMIASTVAMRGSKLKMLKLDLSFWWYYLLEAVLMAICYLDLLLPALGVELPFNPTAAYFTTLILYCILELLLHLWKKAQVETTYALAYRAIVHAELPEDPQIEHS